MRRKITTLTGLKSSLFVAFLLLAGAVQAATQTSSGSGNWSSIFTNTPGDSYVIASGHTVTLDANRVVNGSVTVNGTLIFSGENYLSGTGTFTTTGGSTLQIQAVLGINSSSSGNMRLSGTKSFSTGTSYIYNGSSDQFTGGLLPSSVLNLTIDNDGQVDLSNNVSITNMLSLVDGEFHVDTPKYVLMKLGSSFDITENVGDSMSVWYNPSYTEVSLTQFGPFQNEVRDELTYSGYSDGYVDGRVRIEFDNTLDCHKIPFGFDGLYYPIEHCMKHNSGFAVHTYEFELIRPNSLTGQHSSVTYVNPDYYYRTEEISVSAALGQQETIFHWLPHNGFYYGVSNIEGIEHNGSQWRLINGSKTITGTGFNGTLLVNNNSQLRENYTLGFGSPVPVELTSFTGELVAQDVHIKWQTAMEVNADYFIVEKSMDGENFTEIGKVSAAGTSNDILDYMMIDPNVEAGVIYYRLVQYDFNGDNETFGPVVVNTGDKKNAKIITFPNPTVDEISVTLPEMGNAGELSIVDVTGKEVYISTVESHRGELEVSIDVSALPRGIYYVRFGNLTDGYMTEMIQLL